MEVEQWIKIETATKDEEWRKVEHEMKVEQGIKLNSDG